MAYLWHTYGLHGFRVSTTVDDALLRAAARWSACPNVHTLFDAALGAFHRTGTSR